MVSGHWNPKVVSNLDRFWIFIDTARWHTWSGASSSCDNFILNFNGYHGSVASSNLRNVTLIQRWDSDQMIKWNASRNDIHRHWHSVPGLDLWSGDVSQWPTRELRLYLEERGIRHQAVAIDGPGVVAWEKYGEVFAPGWSYLILQLQLWHSCSGSAFLIPGLLREDWAGGSSEGCHGERNHCLSISISSATSISHWELPKKAATGQPWPIWERMIPWIVSCFCQESTRRFLHFGELVEIPSIRAEEGVLEQFCVSLHVDASHLSKLYRMPKTCNNLTKQYKTRLHVGLLQEKLINKPSFCCHLVWYLDLKRRPWSVLTYIILLTVSIT